MTVAAANWERGLGASDRVDRRWQKVERSMTMTTGLLLDSCGTISVGRSPRWLMLHTAMDWRLAAATQSTCTIFELNEKFRCTAAAAVSDVCGNVGIANSRLYVCSLLCYVCNVY